MTIPTTPQAQVSEGMIGALLDVDISKGDYRHLIAKWTPRIQAMLAVMTTPPARDDVAAAKAEERERCAKIASDFAEKWQAVETTDIGNITNKRHREGMRQGALEIAAALRSAGGE